VLAHTDTAPVRVSGRPSPGADAKPQAPPPPDPPELAAARRLIQRQQYDEALRGLKKVDAAANGLRGDVALLLGVAYFQLEAYKDAEAALRRAIDLAKGDPPLLGQATFLLGRVLTSAEKRPIRKDSERLRAAEEAYRAVLAMPTMPAENTQLALAQILIRLDRGAEAQEILNTLLKSPDLTDSSGDRACQLLSNPRCATEGCLPTLSYVTPDGKHLTSEDLRGKVVLLSFWAEWCEPCVAAVPDLRRIFSAHQKSPFVMLGVNMHDDRGAMDRFIEKHDVRWPQISGQASQGLIDAMAVSRIPTEFLFDHEGVLVTGSTGWSSRVSDALFQEAARAVQKAKKVAAAAGGTVR
jgi:thioredoxin-like negative regulator of GroEL